jgi:predicted S18 family serine protease
VRRLLIGLLLLIAAGCSEPPQKEIDQAQSAIDAARAAGADKYATEEYSGATATLQKARDSVEQRDYRQALSYALDARQRALEASHLVPEARARAKTAAEAAFTVTSDQAARLEAAIRSAEAQKVPARELRAPRQTLGAARGSLQEARILLDRGNYAEAAAALPAVRGKLELATKAVTSIPPPPKRAKSRKR